MRNAIAFSETRAEATVNASAELSEEHMRLSGHDAALEVYETCLYYAPCSDEDNKVIGRSAQLTRFDAWNATVMTCRTKREKTKRSSNYDVCRYTRIVPDCRHKKVSRKKSAPF